MKNEKWKMKNEKFYFSKIISSLHGKYSWRTSRKIGEEEQEIKKEYSKQESKKRQSRKTNCFTIIGWRQMIFKLYQ